MVNFLLIVLEFSSRYTNSLPLEERLAHYSKSGEYKLAKLNPWLVDSVRSYIV